MIYDRLGKTWAPTSSCLWHQDAQIPRKVALRNQYADLKELFVKTLKVKIPNIGMLVDELSLVVRSKLTVNEVKSLIWQINSFSPSSSALEKLKTLPILPVKVASNQSDPPVLREREQRFCIIDRQPLADAFQGKIDLLDFNLEEVRNLQPFLSSLALHDRYLSHAVAETTCFQGETREPNGKLTKQLRSHAHAFARFVFDVPSQDLMTDNIADVLHILKVRGSMTIPNSYTTYFYTAKYMTRMA